VILNFLRTKELDTRDVDLRLLRLEAEFYGVQPLGEEATNYYIVYSQKYLTLPVKLCLSTSFPFVVFVS
jgi:hypothetical protein